MKHAAAIAILDRHLRSIESNIRNHQTTQPYPGFLTESAALRKSLTNSKSILTENEGTKNETCVCKRTDDGNA